jgi:membrane-bound lytic murein transglycosylase B
MKAHGFIIITIFLTTLALASSCAHKEPAVEPAGQPTVQIPPRPELINDDYARGFVEELLVGKGLDRTRVHAMITDPRMAFDEKFILKNLDFVHPKGSAKHPERMEYDKKYVIKGKAFIEENRDFFVSIQEKYGISPQIITAILIIETRLGTYPQKYNAFQVYANISLISDPNIIKLLKDKNSGTETFLQDEEGVKKTLARGRWAGEELFNLIMLADEIKMDPLEIKGSVAGALGPAQFIPTTFRKWGVDGDGDGEKNPFRMPDAMASIANLLKKSGWRENGDEKKNRNAIWLYNHSDVYVNTIMKLYEELSQT